MRILLLEDDSEVAHSLIRALSMRSHTIVWIESLLEARDEIALDPTFDLAIIDRTVRHEPGGLNNAKGMDLLPLDFPACMYSGLPSDAERELLQKGITGVPVFSKGDPFALLDFIESLEGE